MLRKADKGPRNNVCISGIWSFASSVTANTKPGARVEKVYSSQTASVCKADPETQTKLIKKNSAQLRKPSGKATGFGCDLQITYVTTK